jgi:S-adenosyl-L-methionine hydrolase (adenosine-forming)
MIITLTTDFGLSDPFVGIMKGVIFGIAPGAQVVDITHDIGSYDVLEGAFLVESAYRYFPEGTVHVVVVDPGVGSARRSIAAAARGHVFVGPDNGVLSAVLDSEVYHITNRDLFLKSVSQTFHGRDIFSPVAAHLVKGLPIDAVGPRILDFIKKQFPAPRLSGDRVLGTVLRIDKFGNIITNLRRGDLGRGFTIHVAGLPITRFYSNFSEAERGQLFALEGSTGFIELALNQGSAADKLKVERGMEIEVESGSANN